MVLPGYCLVDEVRDLPAGDPTELVAQALLGECLAEFALDPAWHLVATD